MSEPLVLVEESRTLPLLHVTLSFRVGAASDPPGKEGLTRIMARMLRRGVAGMSSHAIEERIDSLGAEFSADVSPSVLSLHGDVISRSIDPFFDLLAQIMSEPTFDAVELGRLLREAEGELVEARDNDRGLANRQFRGVLFGGHPYGRRLGGTIPSLHAIERADVVSRHRQIFTRGNAVVAFSGDVSEARARKLTERLLARLPAGATEQDAIAPPTTKPGRRLVFVDKPERTQTQILIGGLGSHPASPEHVPLHVATTVFGGTFTSRLMREVRSKRGWSYGAYARLSYERQRDSFSMWTFPAAKDAAACIALELELLHAFREKGITPRELSFAKKYITRSHAFDIDTPEKRVHMLLDTHLFDLPADYHDRFVEHVKGVTLEQANDAVRAKLSEEDLVVAILGTHSEIGDAVAKAIPNLAESTVVPFDAE